MSALRAIGSGLGCALFAGLGAFVGSSVGEAQTGLLATREERAVGGAMVGSAIGALLIGALAGAGGGGEATDAAELRKLVTAAKGMTGVSGPRWP